MQGHTNHRSAGGKMPASRGKRTVLAIGVFCAFLLLDLILSPSFWLGNAIVFGGGVAAGYIAFGGTLGRRGSTGLALLAVAAVGIAAVPSDDAQARTSSLERQAAMAAIASMHTNHSDLAALRKARAGKPSRVFHPAKHHRTRAQLRHRVRAAERYVMRKLKAREKFRPMARTADFHGLALTTNIGALVAMSHINGPMTFVYARNGETVWQDEVSCPSLGRSWGSVDEIAMPCDSHAAVNVLADCQDMTIVVGNDLFYTTGWSGQGVVTTVDLCLGGDIGPVRQGWGGPDQTFAERSAPEVNTALQEYFGWGKQ